MRKKRKSRWSEHRELRFHSDAFLLQRYWRASLRHYLSFNEASNELVHEIGWRGNVFSEPANLDQSMLRKSVQVFEQNPLATFIVTVRGLILVAIRAGPK